jgi:DNA mismatch endonuclease (patch repair protein)
MTATTLEARSRIMSAIRKQDTKPELAVRRFLHARGLRYVLYSSRLRGTPDLVFPSRRAVVFVHGCFWHSCPHCPAGRKIVRSNIDYWHPKLARNIERDIEVRQELETLGWTTFTVWECQTDDMRALDDLAEALLAIRGRAISSKAYPIARQHRPKLRRLSAAHG